MVHGFGVTPTLKTMRAFLANSPHSPQAYSMQNPNPECFRRGLPFMSMYVHDFRHRLGALISATVTAVFAL